MKDFILPHDDIIEKELLGTFINYPNSIFKVIKYLQPELMYRDTHYIVLKAILSLCEQGLIIDSVLVHSECKKLTEENLMPLVAELSTKGINPSNVEYLFFNIAEMYIKRQIIIACQKALIDSQDISKDFSNIYEELRDTIEKAYHFVDREKTIDNKEVLTHTFNNILLHYQGDIVPYYKTGNQKLDDILMIDKSNILLIGGKSGAGKTKFTSKLIFDLLRINSDVSVLWYTMEDPTDKIIRCFLSSITKLSDSQLLSRDYKMTQGTLDYIIGLRDQFMSYDIEFIDRPSRVSNVSSHFKTFCKKRPDNLNVLIVDNLMILEDNNFKATQVEKDDMIARGFQKLMNDTQGFVILIHHYTDEQLDKSNFSNGYRPRLQHLKGSTRYRDIATQVMLINKPGNYPDIVDHYKGKPYVKDLFLTDICKNRNNKEGLIRWYGDLKTNIFIEL